MILQETQLPRGRRQPTVTWVLLAINTIGWIAMESAGGSEEPHVLLDFGALSSPLIANGEYWRLFTAMFLHVGFMHLLFNGIALLIFGRLVERIYGPVRFGLIYVLAGLAGSIASYHFLDPGATGAGASGAIFGVLGALGGFFFAKRDVMGEMGRQSLSGIGAIAAINLFFGFVTPGIDNWAHMGGLVGGFVLGVAFAPRYQHQPAPGPFAIGEQVVDTNSLARRWWVVPAAVAVLSAGTWLGTAGLADNAISRIYSAERHLESQSYDEALDDVNRAIRLDPYVARSYYVRARILADLGDASKAQGELFKAIGLARQTRDSETEGDARELLRSLTR